MDQHRRHAGRREPDGHHAGGLQAQENSGKMNRKQLGILIVLGAVIGALSLYVSRRNAASYQSSGEGGAGRKLLPDFPINDVARIGIKQGTNELNLVRQDDNWTVRERYLLVMNGPKDVAVVSDALSEVDTKPDRWLNKDFFKVEKLKAITVTHTNATNSWKLTRETENGTLALADAKPSEQLDTGKSS